MKITELIDKLAVILSNKGDLPVYIRQWGGNGIDLLKENEITTQQAKTDYFNQEDCYPDERFDLPDRVELN